MTYAQLRVGVDYNRLTQEMNWGKAPIHPHEFFCRVAEPSRVRRPPGDGVEVLRRAGANRRESAVAKVDLTAQSRPVVSDTTTRAHTEQEIAWIKKVHDVTAIPTLRIMAARNLGWEVKTVERNQRLVQATIYTPDGSEVVVFC